MSRRVKGPDGIVRIFPDDATDAEIGAALESAHGPTMSAATKGTALPDTADARYEATWGEKPLIPEAARTAWNTPLARPTGIDAIDAFTSPLSLVTMAAGPVMRAAGRLAGKVPVPTGEQVREGVEILSQPWKKGVQYAGGKVADALERRAAPVAETAAAPRGAAVAQAATTPMATLAQPTTAATPIQALRDAATRLGQILQPYELSNGKDLLLRGVPPEKAVEVLIRNRPTAAPAAALSPAEAFNAKFGTLNDAEVRAALDQRNASGQIKTPSAQTARERRATLGNPQPSADAVPFQPMKLERGLSGESGYVYHATNAERAADIAASGKLRTFKPSEFTDQNMWPDGSVEKRAYFVKSPEHAYQFAPEGGQPVVLRTKVNPAIRREATGDLFTRQPVPSTELEILGADGKWHRLTDAFAVPSAAGGRR